MPLLDYKPVPEHVVVIKPVSLLGPVTVSVLLLDLFHLFLKAMEHLEGVAYRFEEDMQCLAHECSHINSGLFCK